MALAVVSAALLTPSLLAPAALADDGTKADKDGKEKKPKPPAKMSTVGGPELGTPGPKVDPRPGEKPPKLPAKLTARSWIVADAESGDVLAANNAHWRLAPASTLKMLFADTLLPKFDKDSEYRVKPSDLAEVGAGSSLVGVKENLTYSVDDLWRGVFLRSGNDAVHVLSAMNGGVERTVAEMNAHAKKLRALDTHAVTPDGYDEPGQVSSAYDLTLIARSGLHKEDFREYAATVSADFPGGLEKDGKKDTDGDGQPDATDEPTTDDAANGEADPEKAKNPEGKREKFQIQNTNRLLTGAYDLEPYPGIAGVKNGYTSRAGNTFTGVAERDGRVLLVTVMHPDEKGSHVVYKEAAKLLDWGFAAADDVRPVGELVQPVGAKAPGDADGDGDGQDAEQAGTGPEDGVDDDATAVAGGQEDGAGTALGLAGAAVVVLGGVAWLVHRRWPAQATSTAGAAAEPEAKPAPDA